jgi:hypothetical protein
MGFDASAEARKLLATAILDMMAATQRHEPEFAFRAEAKLVW